MYIEKRSIPLAIVFSIITCGIYFIYWEYKLWDSLYKANGLPSNAGVDVLLSFVTCGIYFFYMLYKAGKMETSALQRYNLPEKEEAMLYVILAVFGLSIVSFAILQSNINNLLADAHENAQHDPQRRDY